jgi:AAA+ superfamily predicted ATPase
MDTGYGQDTRNTDEFRVDDALAFVRNALGEWLSAHQLTEADLTVTAEAELAIEQLGEIGPVITRESLLSRRISPLHRAGVSGLPEADATAALGLLLEDPPERPFGDRIHVHVAAGRPPASPSAPGTGTDREGIFREIRPTLRLTDLVLSPDVESQLRVVLFAIRDADPLFDHWGMSEGPLRTGNRRKVSNLSGPSGTGKSETARALAGELGLPLLEINYAQLESEYVGRTSKNIELAFARARKTGAVLFFDEADGFFGHRVTDVQHATDVAVNNTRAVMLIEMERHPGPVVLASNLPGNYDKAFHRRILEFVEFPLPNADERVALLTAHLPPRIPGLATLDLNAASKSMDGLSGGDIANIVARACLTVGLRISQAVDPQHITDADLAAATRRVRRAAEVLEPAGQSQVLRLPVPNGAVPPIPDGGSTPG